MVSILRRCRPPGRADRAVAAIIESIHGERVYLKGAAAPISSFCHCRAVTTRRSFDMHISLSIGPVISLIAGILILIVPRLLNYIVAFYLILIGLVGLLGSGYFHVH
jgi:hypothetical protein